VGAEADSLLAAQVLDAATRGHVLRILLDSCGDVVESGDGLFNLAVEGELSDQLDGGRDADVVALAVVELDDVLVIVQNLHDDVSFAVSIVVTLGVSGLLWRSERIFFILDDVVEDSGLLHADVVDDSAHGVEQPSELVDSDLPNSTAGATELVVVEGGLSDSLIRCAESARVSGHGTQNQGAQGVHRVALVACSLVHLERYAVQFAEELSGDFSLKDGDDDVLHGVWGVSIVRTG